MPKRPPSAVRIEGDIAYVDLGRGYEAVIDRRDVEIISRFRWNAQLTRKGHAYAARTCYEGGRPHCVLMHRFLLKPPDGVLVDHKDGDGFNNRRDNLRFATASLNNANMVASRRSRLGLKGVSTNKRGRYEARIEKGELKLFIGTFDTPEEASAAYFGAARVLWGDYARR